MYRRHLHWAILVAWLARDTSLGASPTCKPSPASFTQLPPHANPSPCQDPHRSFRTRAHTRTPAHPPSSAHTLHASTHSGPPPRDARSHATSIKGSVTQSSFFQSQNLGRGCVRDPLPCGIGGRKLGVE